MEIKKGASPEERLAEAERRIEEARRTGAESLDLGDLELRELPAGLLAQLADIQELQSLNLSDTGVRNLAPLRTLQQLQRLDLFATGVTDLTPLASLERLERLSLPSTRVTDLAPLANLKRLKILGLSATRVTDLAPLKELLQLQRLDLSSTGVTDLAPLANLKRLEILGLSATGVTDLSPLASLQRLERLSLSATCVTNLRPLMNIQSLQQLDLYGCRPDPATFCDLADHSRLTILEADEVAGIPREVLSLNGDNCLPRLRAYRAELKLGSEAKSEVKVILLGNGRVGKTQVCRRLRDEPFDESIPSTHGVQIWRQELLLQTGDRQQAFQINWWDFGGQEIYHGTHALFMRSRAIFIILWTPKLENREEYDEDGLTLRNQPLAYWLDYVRTLAGQGSAVIVVQSQCDRFEEECTRQVVPIGGFFRSCSYSAKVDLGRAALAVHLHDAILYLLERNEALEIGRGRAEVQRRLYAWRSENQDLEPEKRLHRTLSLREFRALCEEVGDIVSWEYCLDYFHQTGVVFYQPDLLSDRIILDQDWALDAIYTVFHRARAVPLLRDSGRFTREDLAVIAWQKHALDEQKLFLSLMESCAVCFACGETSNGERRYVAPDLLPKFEAIRLSAWKEEADMPTLRLKYQFFHPAVIRGLMRQVASRAEELAEYWKYGLWFKDGRRDTQLLVQFVDTSTDAAPGAGILEVKAQGRDPLGLLSEVRRMILCQRIGEEHEELLSIAGATVDQALDIEKKPAADSIFSAFFEGRELLSAESPALRDFPAGSPPRYEPLTTSGEIPAPQLAAESILEAKRKDGIFDVFLCHNSIDKIEVKSIARKLKARGILPWLDEWELPPGRPWQKSLEAQIGLIKSAAVFFGPEGLGHWQEQEMYGFLREFVARDNPVIPVFLPSAPEKTELPIFLRAMTLVDFRVHDPDPFIRLVWGITGERPPEQPLAAQGLLRINITPIALTADDKHREAFISYAWGDDTPEGKAREEVVDRLYAALTADGFSVVRDRDRMRPGDLISSFMRQLTRADRVVAVISDKYLRSPYCMSEIHGLWQRSQEDAELLAECLVPIILPEVKSERLADRAVYVRYWKAQKKELEGLFRELGPDLADGSLRKLRQVRAFAQDVDGILRFLQDVLMPRKLEAHLDHGFEAVRAALRRRIEADAER